MNKIIKKFALVFSFMILFFIVYKNTYANEVVVNDFQEFKTAIRNKEAVIKLGKNLILTETINLDNDISIIGDSKTLEANNLVEMFNISADKVTFSGVKFDGKNTSRAMLINNGANVNINDSEILNCSSVTDSNNAEGGAIKINNATVNISNSTIKGNFSKKNENISNTSTNSHGGAIYGSNATIDLDTVVLENNSIGDDGNGHGGAIHVTNNSRVTINGSKFVGNHLFTKAYVTGGSIYADKDSTVITNKNKNGDKTYFDIVGKFNTGGAIRLLGASAEINDTDFVINSSNEDSYGTSAGAIESEGSSLVVNRSNFSVQSPTKAKLDFSGGFIGVVGEIKKFEVNESSFTGRGKDNGSGLATYGGAICFESLDEAELAKRGLNGVYTYGNAKITKSTFKNLHADVWGGSIALTTKIDEKNNVNLEIIDSNIDMSATQHGQDNFGGGAIGVGKGCTLTLSGTEISQSKSNKGGAIYNQGTTKIDNGSSIWGALAYKLGGAIYNDGELFVGKSTFVYNECGDYSMPNHPESLTGKPELMGKNIYAKKDVVVTPDANLADPRDGENIRDVRVLDGESAILLTGPLSKKINVSVSENKKESEKQYRKVGYVVAKGVNGYEPTDSDAQKLHYVSKTEPTEIAKFDDHESVGVWDYLLNPENNNIVLGQRIKVIYHANANGIDNQDKANFPSEKNAAIVKKPVNIYKQNINVSVLENAPKPFRSLFDFVNWYKKAVTDDNVKENPEEDVVKESTGNNGEITNIIKPNEIDIYAGWTKEIVSVSVTKEWQGVANGEETPEVTIKLLADGKDTGKTLLLNKENSYKGTFTDLEKYKEDGTTEIKYTVGEVEVVGYTSAVSGDMEKGYTVTNTKKAPEKINVSVTKEWEGVANGEETPEVTIKLLADGKDTGKTLLLNNGNSYKGTFTDLEKYQEDGTTEIKYTVEEVSIKGFTSKITGNKNNGYIVTNTKDTPIYGDISVKKQNEPDSLYSTTHDETYKVKPGDILTFRSTIDGSKIKDQIKAEKEKFGSFVDRIKNNIKIDNAKLKFVTKIIPANGLEFPDPSTEEGKAKYIFGPDPFFIEDVVKQNDGTIDVYMTIDNNKISTFADLEKELVTEHKVDNLTLIVNDVKVPDNASYGTKYISSGEISGKFSARASYLFISKDMGPYNWEAVQDKEIPETNLDGTDSLLLNGTDLEKEKIQATIEVVIPKVSVSVTKEWEGVANGEETPEVTIKLLADGKDTGKTLLLNNGNGYKGTFTDLEKYQEDGTTEIKYTVREVEVVGYTSAVSGDMEKGYTVTNTKKAPEKVNVSVTKEWEGVANGEETPEVTIKLLADGKDTGKTLLLNKINSYKGTFTDLEKYQEDGTTEIKYTVGEVEVVGYTSAVSGDMEKGYTVTNTKKENPPKEEGKHKVLPSTSVSMDMALLLVISSLSIILLSYRKNR